MESPVTVKQAIQEWDDEYWWLQRNEDERRRREVEEWREQVLLATYLDFTHVGT